MCWNFEASFITGLFSYITAYIIYNRDYKYDKWLAFFILSFSSIQFLEAIIWKNLDNDINHYVTKYFIPFILASEGVASLYGAGLFEDISDEMYIIYFILAVLIFYISMNSHERSTLTDNNNLRWTKENDNLSIGIMFALFITLPFMLYMKNDDITKYTIIGGTFATLIYSIILYKESWGSNWCFFGNILNIFILLRPYL